MLSLSLAGLADWTQVPQAWLVWWVGDALGALVVMPVLVAWLGRPSEAWYEIFFGVAKARAWLICSRMPATKELYSWWREPSSTKPAAATPPHWEDSGE